MSGKGCTRKHTPIVSEKQRGFFGAELRRAKTGKKRRSNIKVKDLRSHLKEAKGKRLSKSRGKRKNKWERLVEED